jgi:hypothetical protein
MKYSFHPSAKIELQEAINYYEEYQKVFNEPLSIWSNLSNYKR